jgi:hypothetical protein
MYLIIKNNKILIVSIYSIIFLLLFISNNFDLLIRLFSLAIIVIFFSLSIWFLLWLLVIRRTKVYKEIFN